MDAIKTIEHKGKIIKIYPDESPESPATWGNLGEILYMKSSRYTLGYRGATREEIDALRARKDVYSLPVFAYVHSGSAISLDGSRYPFNCPWDGGQSGIAYVTHDAIRKEFNVKRITRATLDKVRKILASQVDTFSEYLQGEVYGYTVTNSDGSDGDSCWGFYGLAYCESSAREAC